MKQVGIISSTWVSTWYTTGKIIAMSYALSIVSIVCKTRVDNILS